MALATSLEDETRRFLTALQTSGTVNRKDLETVGPKDGEPFDRRRLADIFNVLSIYTFIKTLKTSDRSAGRTYSLDGRQRIEPPIVVRELLTDLEHNYNQLFQEMLVEKCKRAGVGNTEYYYKLQTALDTIELCNDDYRGPTMKTVYEYLDDYKRDNNAQDLKAATDFIISQASTK